MRPSLLICPVGGPVPTHPDFDNKNHWRYGGLVDGYEVMAVCYNDDFVPERESYTWLYRRYGMKWAIAKSLLEKFELKDFEQYEYIGFIDDDLLMTKADVTSCLNKAHELNSKLFQLSVDKNSDCWYKILYQNDLLEYSTTNFIEIMAPFIHTDKMPLLKKFWDSYDINCGWGLDSILCYILMESATVFHDVSMIHPKKQESGYDKAQAFLESSLVLNSIYPAFMQKEYGIDAPQVGDQKIISRKVRN